MVAAEGYAHCNSIDGDGGVRAADSLPWKSGDMLQQRHALGQVVALVKERGLRFGWRHQEQFADLQGAG